MQTRRPILLDLFCKAGGAAMGYYRAGFDVVGVDIEHQKRYPFEFVQADAMEYLRTADLSRFDAIHASPPCQVHSCLSHLSTPGKHMDLIPQTRAALRRTGLHYVIENVPGAPLCSPVMLCGTMFGLQTECGAQLRRHRLFETSWLFLHGLECAHRTGVISVNGTGQSIGNRRTISVHGSKCRDRSVRDGTYDRFPIAAGRAAMGIDWMVMSELSQAIPPAYTQFIGRQLIGVLGKEIS